MVSRVEQVGRPGVSQIRFFESFGPDVTLTWKRRGDGRRRAGLRVLAKFGDFERAGLVPHTTRVKIRILEKPG